MRASWRSCCGAGMLLPVYRGETSALEVQQIARSYSQLTEDMTRVMARMNAS
jgi:hypothetical protein